MDSSNIKVENIIKLLLHKMFNLLGVSSFHAS